MHKNRIGIIVLAAGASSRMGTPKQLIKIGGVSLVRRAAQSALDSGCHPVVIVLGANADSIRRELDGLDLNVAVNLEWETGISASIRCGLKHLLAMDPGCEGVLLMLADQPGVTGESLKKIIAAQTPEDSGLIAARFNGVIGTPAFFPRKYFDELLRLNGPGGAGSLLKHHGEQVLPVDLPEAELDLDTPEDIALFTRKNLETSNNRDAGRSVQKIIPTMENIKSFPSPDDGRQIPQGQTRRQFIANVTVAGAGVVAAPALIQSLHGAERVTAQNQFATGGETIPVKLRVNGTERTLQLDPRVTLLDALRERLGLAGSKKGCDHGQCGACTVLVNGRRINSCLALAVVHDGDDITTIEGLADGDELHPVQAAFLEHDGFQCGYCTPGQICSAVALLKEGHAGDDAEIREWMSGNICRCGAYTNIVAAIREAKIKTGGAL